MSSCQHEHSGHGDHHHGHEHDHTDDVTPATQSLLYEQIEFDGINTLNEAEPLSGAAIVKKTWAQRSDVQPELHSDADEQLLMTIP